MKRWGPTKYRPHEWPYQFRLSWWKLKNWHVPNRLWQIKKVLRMLGNKDS